MDDKDQTSAEAEGLIAMSESVDNAVTVMARMRSKLLEQGFSSDAADAAALQYQGFMLTTAAEAHKASLQPPQPRGYGGMFR